MFFEMVTYSKLALQVQVYNLFSAKPVKSEEEARELGERIAHQLYDGTEWVDFNRYEKTPRVSDNGNIYSIYYSRLPKKYIVPDHVPLPEGEPRERLVYPSGGGGPWIKIEKSTGKIILWGLQK